MGREVFLSKKILKATANTESEMSIMEKVIFRILFFAWPPALMPIRLFKKLLGNSPNE